MSPRFSYVFQFSQRWLNWLNRQPPDSVRTVVMELWLAALRLWGGQFGAVLTLNVILKNGLNLPAKVEAAHIVASKLAYNGLTIR